MSPEPLDDLGMFVGRVVVEHDVDLLVRRDLVLDDVEEPDKLLVGDIRLSKSKAAFFKSKDEWRKNLKISDIVSFGVIFLVLCIGAIGTLEYPNDQDLKKFLGLMAVPYGLSVAWAAYRFCSLFPSLVGKKWFFPACALIIIFTFWVILPMARGKLGGF